MTRERDFQRRKLYRAEREAGFFESQRLNKNELESIIRDILHSDFVKDVNKEIYKAVVPINYVPDKYLARFNHTGFVLPEWSHRLMIIMHEASHCIHLTNEAWQYECGHGWRFANFYLRLVKSYICTNSFIKLQNSFVKHKVKFYEK